MEAFSIVLAIVAHTAATASAGFWVVAAIDRAAERIADALLLEGDKAPEITDDPGIPGESD